jgi:hypothetical protein
MVGLLLLAWVNADAGNVNSSAPRHDLWIDFTGEIMRDMTWRDGDIVVAVPMKSGTTWTMNIVHQLRSRGDPEVRDIYESCHWLEFWEHPTQTKEELYHMMNRDPTWFPRCFNTHWEPPRVPFNPRVRYVVVMRDPRDALGSILPFLHKHRTEFIQGVWGAPLELFRATNVSELFFGPLLREGQAYIDFLMSWWEVRNEPNVLFLHYTEMVQDHRGTIKKVADFLKMDLTLSEFDRVCEFTSFKWMKEHSEKFSMQYLLEGRGGSPLEREGMIRNGKVGAFDEEVSEDVLAAFERKANEQLSPAQVKWLFHGGSLEKK